MTWLFLFLAIVLEVSGTTCMKLSQAFTKALPSALMFVLYVASFTSLAFALKKIDVGTAYAIWSGVGTALIAMIGVLWFRESMTAAKAISIAMIIAGVVGLHLSGAAR